MNKEYVKRKAKKAQRRKARKAKAQRRKAEKQTRKLRQQFIIENNLIPQSKLVCGGFKGIPTTKRVSGVKPVKPVEPIVNYGGRMIVDLSKKSGMKALLRTLVQGNAAKQLGQALTTHAELLLENIDQFNTKEFQDMFNHFLGISDGLSGKRFPVAIRKRDGKLYAILPREKTITGTRKYKDEIGSIMLNWDQINRLLNEVGANTYQNAFYSGTYSGWASWVLSQMDIQIPEQLFIHWIRELNAKQWPKIFNLGFAFINGLIMSKLSKKEIQSVIGDKNISQVSEDEYIKLLSLLFKKL